MVFETSDVLLKDISTDLVVLNHTRDTELLDTVTNGNELGGSPKETVEGDATDHGLKVGHRGLIVPGLDVEDDGRLGNDNGLLGLLGLVLGETSSLGSLGSSILFLIIRTEEIDVIVRLLGGNGTTGSILRGGLLGTRETKCKKLVLVMLFVN